jgi:cytochrome c-type biogenesis protein CcmH
MGWIILLALMAASVGGLWLLRVRGAGLTAGAAALLIGGAGYALQGRPEIPSAPSQGTEAGDIFPLTQARHAFFGDFSPEESWLRMSEALARAGESADAVGILQNAVKR